MRKETIREGPSLATLRLNPISRINVNMFKHSLVECRVMLGHNSLNSNLTVEFQQHVLLLFRDLDASCLPWHDPASDEGKRYPRQFRHLMRHQFRIAALVDCQSITEFCFLYLRNNQTCGTRAVLQYLARMWRYCVETALLKVTDRRANRVLLDR